MIRHAAARVEEAHQQQHRATIDGKFLRRAGQRLRIQGVTYGPMKANQNGEPFPSPDQLERDFKQMQGLGINSVRIYHAPTDWLLEKTDELEIQILVDVPWAKHLCFLDSTNAQQQAREAVKQACGRGHGHPSLLAYSIGNEISPNIVRWHGARKVERFLRELMDVAKQADPDGLVTYANYPPTEYLDLSFLDFSTFNVYLHDRETFRRYLLRLQNLVGDKPLVLGELGMDTLRHGERRQADFLSGHLEEAVLAGLAGAFVFSWTDEWYAGSLPVKEWAFGITHEDRTPKSAFHALKELYQLTPTEMLRDQPRVSVVVCTYNGGRTLDQCLRSLKALDYSNYEVIVVDDGSTDDTREILKRHPGARTICQSNQGLSAARNVGLQAASGEIIAYTDSDCFADPHWLTYLVHRLQRSDAAAVGGPNLTPEDGWLAGCVAAAPGQPMHVLESDQVAEHIPGCNMAFRREALEAINGFDPQFRKAGDDVDVCWRLQQAGSWITFAPGAFVWHHRRQTVRAYLRQQAGYGEAEALLRFKHPDKYNDRGDGKWRGVVYGPSLQGLRLDQAIIYRGTFGTGLFQCIYQPGPAHWAMLPGTLEWHVLAGIVVLVGVFLPILWLLVALMECLSLAVATLQGVQARLAPRHEGIGSRTLVTFLCFAQPLVRSWIRYRTRFFSARAPTIEPTIMEDRSSRLSLAGRRNILYWTESGHERTQLLGLTIVFLNERGWGKTIDSGWKEWDLQIHCNSWTVLQMCTAQEDHGQGKRLIRVRYRLRPRGFLRLFAATALLAGLVAASLQSWPLATAAGALLVMGMGAWLGGARKAGSAIGAVDQLATQMGLFRCSPAPCTPAPYSPAPYSHPSRTSATAIAAPLHECEPASIIPGGASQ